jgi:transposase
MPRPTKLTPQIRDHIAAAIRSGNYADAAAKSAGIGETTYYQWLKRGESNAKVDRPFREFREAIKKAEGEAEVHAVALVRQAMPDNWQAAMTWLERRFPDRWRRRDAVAVEGSGGGPVRISEEAFADPKVRKAAHELVRRVGAARQSE